MENENFDEYMEYYKKLPLTQKKEIALNQLKVLTTLTNKMCQELNVENEIIINKELLDVNKENPTESIPVTREDLKPMCDQSTVTFTAEPRYYVNAFAMLYDYQKVDLRVYMGSDNKPYIDEACTEQLDTKYWEANDDGTFKKFVGAMNAWDCTVTPPAVYTVETTHTGTTPADFNVIYKK